MFTGMKLAGAMVAAAAVVAHAQWLNYPEPGVPRLPNGKVDLSAKAPRTRDGKADLKWSGGRAGS
jgi:hypothetical protein